jgi:hypothetical protein
MSLGASVTATASGATGSSVQVYVGLFVGAALTVVGALIAKSYELGRQGRAWLRDQRLKSYAALISTSHEVGRQIGLLALAGSVVRADAISPAVNLASNDLQARIAEVQLLGGTDVTAAAVDLGEKMDVASTAFHQVDWFVGLSKPAHLAFNDHETVVAMNAALDTFIAVARAEVH